MEYVNEKLEEFNNYIRYRKVAIIGLGISNMPLLDYLHEQKAKVTVFDNREIDKMPKEVMDKITEYAMEFSLGRNYLSKLNGFDLIFRSPSCLPTTPELEIEANNGAIVTTEVELLMKMCPCKMIGITGSDGKTTTTTLISEIIKAGGYTCHLGGNIGIPLFTKLNEIKPEDIVVLELSSFQLMGMEVSPDIAVITNVTPNHLNVHKDYEEYIAAKKTIIDFQEKEGILVTNFDNDVTKEISYSAKGKVIYFSSKSKLDNGYIIDDDAIKQCNDKIRKHLINLKDIAIRGIHNYENICTCLAATYDLIDMDKAIKAICEFGGVEHRLEFVREINGVKWYNDSVSSSPTRTIAGLNSYSEKIVLIAGGYDKNLDYSPIARPILEHVSKLILFGATSNKIYDAVIKEKSNENIEIYKENNLNDVVKRAKEVAVSGEIVLFSPASASFDMFKNFADRGIQFKDLVNKI